jgi:hypothetical protein
MDNHVRFPDMGEGQGRELKSVAFLPQPRRLWRHFQCRLSYHPRRLLRHTQAVIFCLKAFTFPNKNGKASASVSLNS